ncbi:MAG TPA: hypothetical protein VGL56_13915 [Fimbriimonadaceae bacterium]|jgi:hypothetical protein
MILPILALVFAPHTGVLKGHVSIGPLTSAERNKYHTLYAKDQSIEGYELEVFRASDKNEENPLEDMALTANGNFKFDLASGSYVVTVSKSMHAGAYSVYPTKKARVRAGKTTKLSLHVRSEAFK